MYNVVGISTIVFGVLLLLFLRWIGPGKVPVNEKQDAGEALRSRQWYGRQTGAVVITIVGLTIMSIEASKVLWVDFVLILSLLALTMILLFIAFRDYLFSQQFYRVYDDGLRTATLDLVDELKKIEKNLAEKKRRETDETTVDSSQDDLDTKNS